MWDFFNNSIYWKCFFLENLLSAKQLFDRGFKVDDLSIGEAILGAVLDMLFGSQNVFWHQIEPSLPDAAERLRQKVEDGAKLTPEEDEAFYWVESYLHRDHYEIAVNVPDFAELGGKLRPKHYRQLMKIFSEVSYTKNETFDMDSCEEFFPWYELVEEIEWQKDGDKITGFWIHLVDVEQGMEEPVSDIPYNDALIRFWDKLKIIKKEVANNACLSKHQNNGRRFRILTRRNGLNDQRKTNRTKHAAGTRKGLAA